MTMWLLDYMTKNSFSKTPSCVGDISHSEGELVNVNASLEHRQLPMLAPYGVVSVPPLGEKSAVLMLESSKACVGVVAPAHDLKPGELMLYSKGGASIVLKNNGQVLINSKVYGE